MTERILSRKALFLYFLPLLFFLCGCFSPGELHLTQQDSGRTFEVKTGSFITVTLPGNPTTGYQWRFATAFDPVVLGLCRDSFLSPTGEKTAGKPGTRLLKFEVIAPGKAALDLEYVRPWEKNGEAAQRFQVMFYCVGKPKSASGNREDELEIFTPRRDQYGNDIPGKRFDGI
ncbi:MAG: protease inhibitor I42 family protein [Lentisphaeria bacterium]|nr:protease inhibitor I42 family protein [Lentisphaeria bacterium]